MGCGASTEAPRSANNHRQSNDNQFKRISVYDPAEVQACSAIERELDRARQEEEGKVKLLLLGAGESGKSTIFKQMRILYGAPRAEEDLRMYGVVIRSNVIVAMRKLCTHLRNLGLEEELEAEAAPELPGAGVTMTPKEAYDQLLAYLVDNTATEPPPTITNGESMDWVGQSPRAGLAANKDANNFLHHAHAIRNLWQVRLLLVNGNLKSTT